MPKLLLASSSRYRQQLLQKLGLAFSCHSPDIDETPTPEETPKQLVERLAIAKAQALAAQYPEHLIIGSDQVASIDGKILGKPGNFARAYQQLAQCRSNTVHFYTGLCLLNPAQQRQHSSVETYRVQFRALSDAQIRHYLEREQPYDCAGSFKCEGLGISLFESLSGQDPNTLVGLPLIALIGMLNKEGIDPLGKA